MFTRKPTFKIANFILLILLLFNFSVIVTRASEVAPPDDNETQDLESLEELLAADEKPEITLKSFTGHNLYVGEGTDFNGVPTKFLTLNGSLRINIYNPATSFGIHVHSSPINLLLSDIIVASGQLKKHYQPRKSNRMVQVNLEGNKVPLYGAGSTIKLSQSGVEVPLTLKLEVVSVGYVVGKPVKTKYHKEITCPLVINSSKSTPIKFNKNSCTYI